jgi:hypothetical protein
MTSHSPKEVIERLREQARYEARANNAAMQTEEYTPAAFQSWADAEALQSVVDELIRLRCLRKSLVIILDWYEQIPNDELPDKSVRKAFAAVNAALGIPEK